MIFQITLAGGERRETFPMQPHALSALAAGGLPALASARVASSAAFASVAGLRLHRSVTNSAPVATVCEAVHGGSGVAGQQRGNRAGRSGSAHPASTCPPRPCHCYVLGSPLAIPPTPPHHQHCTTVCSWPLNTPLLHSQARAGGPSEPPIVDDEQQGVAGSQGGAAPSSPSSAGGRSFQGTPLDSGEGPNPRTSPEDEQKTGGVGQQVCTCVGCCAGCCMCS